MIVRLFVTATILATGAQAAAAQDDAVERGREITHKHCSRCHVVGDFNPNGGISSTPSFQALIKYVPDYEERFKTFFARRPHLAFLTVKGIGRPMPELPANAQPVVLTYRDVLDVVAFIKTLAAKAKTDKMP